MVVIGVTGNIGSGKSTVCQILAKLGAGVIDADKLGHEIYKPHSQAWQEIVATFGKDILRADEEIDRQKLAQVVFPNPTALDKLHGILQPQVQRMIQERVEDYHQQGAKAVALEATLLIEDNRTWLADKIWVVVASQDKVVERLKQQRDISKSQILARLKSQMPAEEKMKYADEVIFNDGDISQLEARVTELWRKLDTT
jgi:dephospho-CoA kinase